MPKLFIKPPHGSLGETMEALRKKQFEPYLIGFGYPPAYVEVEKDDYELIENIVKKIHPDTKFTHYRTDAPNKMDVSEWGKVISRNKLLDILNASFKKADISELCFKLKIDTEELDGFALGKIREAKISLINLCEGRGRLSELTKEMHNQIPTVFNSDNFEPEYITTLME